MSLRKVGKCVNCCPDGGAIFRASWGDADDDDAEFIDCTMCGGSGQIDNTEITDQSDSNDSD